MYEQRVGSARGAIWTRFAFVALFGMSVASLSACKKVPKAGASCSEEGDEVCNGKKSAMLCAGGKWQSIPCRVGAGCVSNNCNNNRYEIGEPCVIKKAKCTMDGKAVIECVDNKWAVIQKCAGMNGCVANAKGWKCDMSTGDVGDPCAESSKDSYACSTDKKTMLRCDGKTMVPHATCAGRHGCRKSFKKITCDGRKPL